MLSTLPGMQGAVFHHQRTHRALHHRIAGVDAPDAAHQVARQTPRQGRVDQAGDAALADAAQVGDGHGQQVHRLGQVLAVEVAAGDDLEAFAILLVEDQRIVGGGVGLLLDDGVDVVQRIEYRAIHLRCAAQRVHVLDAGSVGDVGATQFVGQLHGAGFMVVRVEPFNSVRITAAVLI
jgi:hypothetical protein